MSSSTPIDLTNVNVEDLRRLQTFVSTYNSAKKANKNDIANQQLQNIYTIMRGYNTSITVDQIENDFINKVIDEFKAKNTKTTATFKQNNETPRNYVALMNAKNDDTNNTFNELSELNNSGGRGGGGGRKSRKSRKTKRHRRQHRKTKSRAKHPRK